MIRPLPFKRRAFGKRAAGLGLQKLRFQAVLFADHGIRACFVALSRMGLPLPSSLMSALVSHGITSRLMRSSLGFAAKGRRVVLVTGTNGKTTTTALVVAALGGIVATNPGNHNFFCGLLDTLLSSTTEIVVLEVDELWLPEGLRWLTPELLLILNLFEDAWLRTPSPGFVIDRWRSSLEASRTTILAWADDPSLVALLEDQPVHWMTQLEAEPSDSKAELCPACQGILRRQGQSWSCHCLMQHPASPLGVRNVAASASIWSLSSDGTRLDPPQGSVIPRLTIEPGLMGKINHLNAAFAAAAAVLIGDEPVIVEKRLRQFDSLPLRDSVYGLAGRDVRLLVAKNPAAWMALFDRFQDNRGLILLQQHSEATVDLSWLYDIPVESLRGHCVGI